MATPAEEEILLSSFRSTATREALRALLLAHQDRIYNICFQVLGRREDAEDAAQESLLRLPEGARASSSAAGLRRWIYRVSLRAALDVWRRRESTRRIETRSAMSRPDSTPFEDPERKALIEAMERLSDGERELIVEHYFEKVPLAELGDRQGLSAVAIWKRIDRAREKLKRALLGAGFIAASARVAEALESSVPATAPATLAVETVVGRILAGGLAVGATKSSVGPAVVIALVLLFGIFTGGYLMLRSGEVAQSAPSSSTVPTSESKPTAPQVLPGAVSEAPPVAPAEISPERRLLELLGQYRAVLEDHRAELRVTPGLRFDATLAKIKELMKEIQPLILEGPATFISFLEESGEEMVGHLGYFAMEGLIPHEGVFEGHWNVPIRLSDALLQALKTGSPEVKGFLLGWLTRYYHDQPDVFMKQYDLCLNEPHWQVQSAAIVAMASGRALDATTLERVRLIYEASDNTAVRHAALEAISKTDTPDVQAWMVRQLEANVDSRLVATLASAAYSRLRRPVGTRSESAASDEVNRIAAGLRAAARLEIDWYGFWCLCRATLYLPADKSVPILQLAKVNAPRKSLAEGVETLLGKIRAGGVTAQELEKELQDQVSNMRND